MPGHWNLRESQAMYRSTRSRRVLEMRDERSSDRISSLPDELLIYILSLLSSYDAVRTSTLSSRWRLLFTFANILAFDDNEYFGRCRSLMLSDPEYRKMSFQRFVDRVLAVNIISPIQKFSLVLSDTCHDSLHVCAWIAAALAKQVRHLRLSISLLPSALPDNLFTFKALVSLNICTPKEYVLIVPGRVSLPSLKSLNLYRIAFQDGDSMKRFLAGCSQLKELGFQLCRLPIDRTDRVCVSANALQSLSIIMCMGHAEIDAPNLEYITYVFTSCTFEVMVKSFRSVSRVKLGFITCDASDLPEGTRDLITSAYNARELSLMFNSMKLLVRDEPNQIPMYSNLKNLCLGNCCRDSWKYLPFLLANATQLETVLFEAGLFPYDLYPVEEYEWDPINELAPFSSNVKCIVVFHFQGSSLELQLIKYLLENVGSLERLVVHKHIMVPMEADLRLSMDLLTLPKASTYCRIQLRKPVSLIYHEPDFMWMEQH